MLSPEEIDYGVQIRGVYDGVCYWVLKDGRRVNRFADEDTRRSRMTQEHLDELDAEEPDPKP